MRGLVLAVLLVACGEDGDGTMPPGTPPPVDEAPTGAYEVAAGALSIADPAIVVDGYEIWYPAERLGHEPGEPEAVWLEIERDGVAVAGPTIPNLSNQANELFVLDEPEMSWEVVDESWYGLTVVVNHRLSYRFDIHDFEEEVSVARVDLSVSEAGLESHFILIADSCDGRANISVRALVDGEPVGAASEPLIVRAAFLDPALEDGYPWGPNCSWMNSN